MRRSSLLFWRALPVVATLVLGGCDRSVVAGDGHAGHDHGEEASGEGGGPVQFHEGKGLRLAAETIAALGLKTEEIAEHAITPAYEVTAVVFAAGPPARASAFVPISVADALEKNPPPGLTVRRELAPALAQAELLFALSGTPAVGTPVNLTLHGPPRRSLAVPSAALLRTVGGVFVYVVNGGHLLRTPVQPGALDGTSVEILDGLYDGDVVATTAVDQLWLTELRLTKGGGHSH